MAKISKKERRQLYAAARYYGLSRREASNITSINQLNKRLGKPIVPTVTKSYAVAPPTVRLQHNPYHYTFSVTINHRGGKTRRYLTIVSDLPLTRAAMETRLREKFREWRLQAHYELDESDTIFSYHLQESAKYET